LFRLGRVSISTLFMLAAASFARAEDDAPVELRPYDVTLAIEFDGGPEFPAAFRERVLHDVRSLVRRTIGERWQATILQRSAGDLSEQSDDAKRIEIFIERRGPDYVFTSREWDGTTDTWSSRRSHSISRRAEFDEHIFAAALRAFRPLALIDASDAGHAVLRLQGSAIPTPDPAAGRVAAGTLFAPFLRKFDREGQLVETRAVPYTLLRIGETVEGVADAEILSALRSPLGGRRATVEGWAIATGPSHPETRLTIVRREDEVPLAGRTVEVRDQPFQPGQDETPPIDSRLTDRSGSITLPVREDAAVAWLTIKSGEATLMRLPIAPGIAEHITLPLGDDQLRLDAEGRLAILTGELIEIVAKRATLIATARNSARSGEYDKADEAIAAAEKLPDAATFRRRLAAVETPAAKAAEDAGDRLSAARIRALGRKAIGLVDRYLNADALRAAREEVEELKRTDPNRK
jgi:hypothetical protein